MYTYKIHIIVIHKSIHCLLLSESKINLVTVYNILSKNHLFLGLVNRMFVNKLSIEQKYYYFINNVCH